MAKMLDKIVVITQDTREILSSVIPDTFQEQRTVNQNWTISFNAYDDKSVAYSLLVPQARVSWKGQEFVIKQSQPQFNAGTNIIQVQATHVGYEVSKVVQTNVNTGVKTYSVNDVLSFYLNGNQFGYTWEVIGDFPNQQIENLGGSNGQDMLSKIIKTWDNAIFSPDNKNIRIMSADNFYYDEGKAITYLGNSSSVQLNYDSTGITNKVLCKSEAKEGTGQDGNPPEYYFEPFYVQDDSSIAKYGVIEHNPISDNRFHDPDSMRAYAQSQLQPEATLSIQVNYLMQEQEEIKVGQVRTLIIPEIDLRTKVRVTQTSTHPLSANQASTAQLNSTAQTILDYNNSLRLGFDTAKYNQEDITSAINDAINSNKNAIDKIDSALNNSTSDNTLNVDTGTVKLHRSNNIVYVSVNLSNVLYDNPVATFPETYVPSTQISDNFTITSNGTNYIVNYTLSTQGVFQITGIVSLTGEQAQLKQFSGQFNYLK